METAVRRTCHRDDGQWKNKVTKPEG